MHDRVLIRFPSRRAAGMSPAHVGLAFLVVFVWGTNFVVIKAALADFPPFLFATLRFIFSALPPPFHMSAWRATILSRTFSPIPATMIGGFGFWIGLGTQAASVTL